MSELAAYVKELRARVADAADAPGVATATIDEAASHAALGLPLPRATRGRAAKQLVVRLTRVFTHRQVAFNQAVVSALRSLDAELATMRSEFGGRLAIALHGVEAIRTDLDQHARAVHELLAQLETERLATRSATNSAQAMLATLELDLDACLARIDALAAQLNGDDEGLATHR